MAVTGSVVVGENIYDISDAAAWELLLLEAGEIGTLVAIVVRKLPEVETMLVLVNCTPDPGRRVEFPVAILELVLSIFGT